MFQLPDWLRRYRKRWPNVDLRIHTGESRAVAELVRSRAVDCGFVTSRIRQSELTTQCLYSESILLVVSGQAQVPERVSLAQVPLIMFPAHAGFRRYLERALAAAGLDMEVQVKMEIDSVEATKSLVEVGLGGAFLPEIAVQRELAQGRLRRLTVQGLPTLQRQTSLVRRVDRRPTRVLLNFIDLVTGRSGRSRT
jgi:DNA-binding transcriptional LysR family regulator